MPGENTIFRILGIDPGTHNMGYGLVQENPERGVQAVTWGVLTVRPSLTLGDRLHHLFRQLLELMDCWMPDEVAVEEPFVSVNAKTAMAVGQAQGVALMAAAAKGVPIEGYSPRQLKQAVTGHGGASKEQVQQAILMLLALDAAPIPEDAADALAVAICHLQSLRATTLIALQP